MKRRDFIRASGRGTALLCMTGALGACRKTRLTEEEVMTQHTATRATSNDNLFFDISLAQWSLHRSLWEGELEHLAFAAKARELGIAAVEYVSGFFPDKAEDEAFLSEMNLRAADNGVQQLLIMVDGEGALAHKDKATRVTAIENHHKWVRAAKTLGCHSIRVNAMGKGAPAEVAARAVDSLHQLATYAQQFGMSILVENHGGHSSNGAWLAGVMSGVSLPNCGTLPDFGNFHMALFPPSEYDRYLGVKELMPWAKGVSAKTYDFDSTGEESSMDYARLLGIVKDAGFAGHIGIEYEGSRLGEEAGILATKNLLKRLGQLSG